MIARKKKKKLATNIPPIVYKLMIVAATLIWGSTFVIMKDSIEFVEPSWLIGIRFLLTSFVLATVFWKKMATAFNRKTLLSGSVLGVLIFAAYWFQTVGLDYTTPGKNAFLTAIYCVLVPFMSWMVTKIRPTVYNIAAAFICIAGVGFVSLSNDSLSINFGDAMTLVCGVMFGIHIVATSIFAKNQDVLVLTVFQFFVSGVLGIIVGFFTEVPPSIDSITPEFVFNMFYLIIFGSCIAMGFQNAALAHISPSQVAILLSLESVFGVVFSVIFYNEALSVPLVSGFALIFVSIILSEAFPLKKKGSEAASVEKPSSIKASEKISDGNEKLKDYTDKAIAEDVIALE